MDMKELCPRCSQEGKGAKRGHICICKALTEAHAAGVAQAESISAITWRKKFEEAEAKLAEQKGYVSKLNETVRHWQADSAALRDERDRLVLAVDGHVAKLAVLTAELAAAKFEAKEAREKYQGVLGMRDSLARELANLTAERDAANDEARQMQERLTRVVEGHKALTAENQRMTEVLDIVASSEDDCMLSHGENLCCIKEAGLRRMALEALSPESEKPAPEGGGRV